jgi:hypothetical protein
VERATIVTDSQFLIRLIRLLERGFGRCANDGVVFGA